jgi:hypothetical protein
MTAVNAGRNLTRLICKSDKRAAFSAGEQDARAVAALIQPCVLERI